MFNWKKLGRVFNPHDYADIWMQEYAQAPSVLILDNCVRVFFSSRAIPLNGQYISRLGYIDLSKDNLFDITRISSKPILELGELGTFDEFGTYPASVIQVQNETRVYYAGWTRYESVPFNAAIGLGISNDNGESFYKIGKGPVLSYTPDEPFVLGSPKVRFFNDTWYLWYSSGKEWILSDPKPEPYYKIRMAISKDGINWEKYGKDLLCDVLDEKECQAGADVFHYEGKYHMFFSYRYHLSKQYKIGYASSKDLLTWERNDKFAGIDVSQEGWDSESISYPHIFEMDNKLNMFYQGNEIGKFGFGLAVLES